ncbi:methanol/ethanol family PQQ-dependent dehydrogenase [Dyella ginsengisoli]|jgi:PQQ-dependent dehydrogenase (methanol/ethanol family)|uniref:Methanol/ethanol family PQQ-dependent dehydrogenase n=1 Tax=Dyella ginsengisoli TaxID=363848 RepID=A0ABW8JXI3_9GAMM
MRNTSVRSRPWSIVLGLGLGLAATGAMANDELMQMAKDHNQWVMPSGDYTAQRYSSLDQITADNVKNLHVAWTMSSGSLRGHEGQPLVIGNMMYFESSYPNHVYAVSLDDPGKIVWSFTPDQNKFAPSVACCDVVNRGPAYGKGMIFANALDGVMYALDAKTGAVKWKAQNADPMLGQTMTMAPLVVKDKVITGVSGAEYGVHGYITAYDIDTGKQAWRAFSTGPDDQIMFDPRKTIDGATQKPVGKDSSLKSWQGDQWKLGGGTTWGWYTYDPKLNLLYYGTGNPGTWNPTQRPGDNKYSMSVIARDADTGEAKWVFQMTPHDGWDYDGVNESILSDSKVDGKTIPTLTHFDRNGFAYVWNRANGKLIAAHKFDPAVNWASGIDMKTGRPMVVADKMTKEGLNVKDICPSSQGSKDQQPASYDPNTGLFYVSTNHVCMDYQAFNVKYKAGFPYVGALVNMYPADHGEVGGRFIAFDPISGQTKWAVNDRFQDWSGVLTTKGGIAFYGTLTGWFRAVDINTGKVLWQFKTPSGIIGNPITYTHDGKQYVAILSGVGGWAAIGLSNNLTKASEGLGAVGATATLGDYTNLGGTLMVFALD